MSEGFVYFVQGSATGLVKIGWALDPETRVDSFRCGSPERLVLLTAIPGGRDLERAYHRVFAHARMRGEWFWPIPAIMAHTENPERATYFSDPPDVLRGAFNREAYDPRERLPGDWSEDATPPICPACSGVRIPW